VLARQVVIRLGDRQWCA